MFLCSCNALTDREVRAVAGRVTQDGCGSRVGAIYRELGTEPRCGRCVPAVLKLLRETLAAPASAPAV